MRGPAEGSGAFLALLLGCVLAPVASTLPAQDEEPTPQDTLRFERIRLEAWFAEFHDKDQAKAARLYLQALGEGQGDLGERMVLIRHAMSCAADCGDVELLVGIHRQLVETTNDPNWRRIWEGSHKALLERSQELRELLAASRKSFAEAGTDEERLAVTRELLRKWNPLPGPGRSGDPTRGQPQMRNRGAFEQEQIDELKRIGKRRSEIRARLLELDKAGQGKSDEANRLQRTYTSLDQQQARLLAPSRFRGPSTSSRLQSVLLTLAKDRARLEDRRQDLQALEDIERQLAAAVKAGEQDQVRSVWREAVRRFPELEGRSSGRQGR